MSSETPGNQKNDDDSRLSLPLNIKMTTIEDFRFREI